MKKKHTKAAKALIDKVASLYISKGKAKKPCKECGGPIIPVKLVFCAVHGTPSSDETSFSA